MEELDTNEDCDLDTASMGNTMNKDVHVLALVSGCNMNASGLKSKYNKTKTLDFKFNERSGNFVIKKNK